MRAILVGLLVLVGCGRTKRAEQPQEPPTCDTLAECEDMAARAEAEVQTCKGRKDCDRKRAAMVYARERRNQMRALEKQDQKQAKADEKQAFEEEAAVEWAKIESDKCALELDEAACLQVNKFGAKYRGTKAYDESVAIIETFNRRKREKELEEKRKREEAAKKP